MVSYDIVSTRGEHEVHRPVISMVSAIQSYEHGSDQDAGSIGEVRNCTGGGEPPYRFGRLPNDKVTAGAYVQVVKLRDAAGFTI